MKKRVQKWREGGCACVLEVAYAYSMPVQMHSYVCVCGRGRVIEGHALVEAPMGRHDEAATRCPGETFPPGCVAEERDSTAVTLPRCGAQAAGVSAQVGLAKRVAYTHRHTHTHTQRHTKADKDRITHVQESTYNSDNILFSCFHMHTSACLVFTCTRIQGDTC